VNQVSGSTASVADTLASETRIVPAKPWCRVVSVVVTGLQEYQTVIRGH
jgi:hypothetical protein